MFKKCQNQEEFFSCLKFLDFVCLYCYLVIPKFNNILFLLNEREGHRMKCCIVFFLLIFIFFGFPFFKANSLPDEPFSQSDNSDWIGDDLILEEIIKVLERDPEAGYERVVAEINHARSFSRSWEPVSEDRVYRIMTEMGLLETQSEEGDVLFKEEEDALLLEEISQVLEQHPDYGYQKVTDEINRTRSVQGLESIGSKQIYRIMKEEDLLKKRGGQIDRNEDALLLEEIRRVLEQHPDYGIRRVADEINRARSAQGLKSISTGPIYRLMREAGLLKKSGVQIDRNADAMLLEEIRRVLEQHPNYGFKKVADEINRTRSALGLENIGTRPIYRLMSEAGLLKKGGKWVDKSEDVKILEEIRRVLEQYPDYGFKRVTVEINRVRSAQGLENIGTGPIRRLMREAGFQGEGGRPIDRNEDALLLEEIRRVLEQHPNYGFQKVTVEINRTRSAQDLKSISTGPIYRLMSEAGLLKKRGRQINRSEEDTLLFQEIMEVLEKYPEAGFGVVTNELNYTRSARGEKRIGHNRIYKFMRDESLLEKVGISEEKKSEDVQILEENNGDSGAVSGL